MFRLLFLFLVLAGGLYVGNHFGDSQGMVAISMTGKTYVISFVQLVIGFVLLLGILFFTEAVLSKSLRFTSASWNWFGLQKLKRARRNTNEGIIKLLEGDLDAAEKKVTRWASCHDEPVLCYLIAAEAAQGLGEQDKRNRYLTLAEQQDNHQTAIKLTKARLLIRSNEYLNAYDLLAELKASQPNNPVVLTLLKDTYLNLELWSFLDDLLPKLAKQKLVNDTQYQSLLHKVKAGKIAEVGQQGGTSGLMSYWDKLSRKEKSDEVIVTALVRQLMRSRGDIEAFGILKDVLKKNPSDALYALLAELDLHDTQPAINFLAGVVKKDPRNASANSALGQYYLDNEQWPEAQQAFESAIANRDDISDYAYLSDSLEKQGRLDDANQVSRQALTLIDKKATEQNLLEQREDDDSVLVVEKT